MPVFCAAKAFEGHSGIIQRNALKSWALLHPDVEVILLGDYKGAAEIAAEMGLGHQPHVERNEFGTKRLDSMLWHAQAMARHQLLNATRFVRRPLGLDARVLQRGGKKV
jgi:hypothetical protein